MSSKKMGRPKSDNPKSKTIEIRVDEEILSNLDVAAEKLNTNRSAIVRKGIEKIYEELQNKKEAALVPQRTTLLHIPQSL
ncbi:CopG family transcriptional regulator [Paenibacillus amylolyticus]|uniref:ribbon-helix-helix domain-containing protein n=1 Tax=Paenibacillus amylolyticus TaxID=1451 RepID=UPI003EC100BF